MSVAQSIADSLSGIADFAGRIHPDAPPAKNELEFIA